MNLKDHDEYCNCEQALHYLHVIKNLVDQIESAQVPHAGTFTKVLSDAREVLREMKVFDALLDEPDCYFGYDECPGTGTPSASQCHHCAARS